MQTNFFTKFLLIFFATTSMAHYTHTGVVNTIYQSGKIVGGAAMLIRGIQLSANCITTKSLNHPRGASKCVAILHTLVHTLGYIGCGEVIMQDGLSKLGCSGNGTHRKFAHLFQKIQGSFYQKPPKEKPNHNTNAR